MHGWMDDGWIDAWMDGWVEMKSHAKYGYNYESTTRAGRVLWYKVYDGYG